GQRVQLAPDWVRMVPGPLVRMAPDLRPVGTLRAGVLVPEVPGRPRKQSQPREVDRRGWAQPGELDQRRGCGGRARTATVQAARSREEVHRGCAPAVN